MDEAALGLPFAGQVDFHPTDRGAVRPRRVSVDALEKYRSFGKGGIQIPGRRKLRARPARLVPAAPAQPRAFGQFGGMLLQPLDHFLDAVGAGQVGIEHREAQPHHVTVGVYQARNHGTAGQVLGNDVRPLRSEFFGSSDIHDAPVPVPRHGLRDGLIGIHGVDLAVDDHAGRLGCQGRGGKREHRGECRCQSGHRGSHRSNPFRG